MPAAVPIIAALAASAAAAAAPGAFTLATGIALTATQAAIVGAIAGAVVGLAVSAAGQAIFPVRERQPERLGRASGGSDSAFSRTQQVRQPLPVARAIYGRVRVAGPMVFLHTNASARTAYASQVNGGVARDYRAEELLYVCVAIAGHEIDAVESVLLDTNRLSDERYRGLAYAEWKRGEADQAALPLLLAECDGFWTADHRGRGNALLAAVYRFDDQAFPSGVPNLSAVVRGRRVYDPRTGLTAYSNNVALCVADYITADFGLAAGWEEIDEAALIEAANICDELIPADGGAFTERRYTIGGTIELNEAPGRVLERMVAGMAGAAVYSGGLWRIHAGAYREPVMTLTEDHLAGPVEVRANRALREKVNGVRASYIRPAAGWQPTDAPPLVDAAALAADGGREAWADLDLDMTTSGFAAQRLMQLALRRNRMQRGVSLRTNLIGLALQPDDRVTLSLPRLPASVYRVVEWALTPSGAVSLSLEQDEPAVYAWDPAADERPLPPVRQGQTPGGFAFDAPAVTVTTPTAATFTSLTLTWGAISGVGSYDAEWRAPSTSAWTASNTTGVTIAFSTGGRAAFRVRARALDLVSAWRDVPIPSAPGLSVVGTLAGIQVQVSLPSGAARAQVFIGTTDVLSAATKHTTDPTTADPLAITIGDSALRWVWARTVAADGNVSAESGPVLVTPGVEVGGGSAPPPSPDPGSGEGGGEGSEGDSEGGGGEGGE
jgi:hypothetical protein